MSGDFCRLLIIFPNSLDPDQDGHNVGPDLDPNCSTLLISLPDFFFFLEKIILKKVSRRQQQEKLPRDKDKFDKIDNLNPHTFSEFNPPSI